MENLDIRKKKVSVFTDGKLDLWAFNSMSFPSTPCLDHFNLFYAARCKVKEDKRRTLNVKL